jgi:hypothetical protein
MRTNPLYAPEFPVGADGRASPSVNRVSLLAPPGRYTVTLEAGGLRMSQPLEVRKDPNTTGTDQDIATQTALAQDISTDLNGVAEMVNTLEKVRAQIATLRKVTGDTAVVTAADSLDQKVIAVEGQMTQLRITGRGQDLIRYQAMLAEKLVYLFNDVGSTDNAPTGPQRDVAGVLKERARTARVDFDRLLNRDIEGFNRMLRDKGLGGIIAKPEPPKTS